MSFDNDIRVMKDDLTNSLNLTPEQRFIVDEWFRRNFETCTSIQRMDARLFLEYGRNPNSALQSMLRSAANRIANDLLANYTLSFEQIEGQSVDSMHYASFKMPLLIMKRTRPDGTR